MWELYAYWAAWDNALGTEKSPAAGRVSAAGYRNGALLIWGVKESRDGY